MGVEKSLSSPVLTGMQLEEVFRQSKNVLVEDNGKAAFKDLVTRLIMAIDGSIQLTGSTGLTSAHVIVALYTSLLTRTASFKQDIHPDAFPYRFRVLRTAMAVMEEKFGGEENAKHENIENIKALLDVCETRHMGNGEIIVAAEFLLQLLASTMRETLDAITELEMLDIMGTDDVTTLFKAGEGGK